MTALLLLAASAAFAAEPAVEVTASTNAAQLAVPVVLTATARLPAGAALTLDLARSATDVYTITKVADTGAKDGVQSFRVELLPLAVGKVPVALAWTLASPQGASELESPPFWLDVKEPPSSGPGEIQDIKAPKAARPLLWPWLLAAALGWAAYELYKRRRRDASEEPLPALAADGRSPEVIAEEALAGLESSGLWDEGRFKEFYIRLTDVLRQYLERRYGIPASRLTTVELARHLRQAELDRLVSVMFRELFDRADLVKFAKTIPEADQGRKDLEAARRVVRETTPKPREPQGAPA